MGKLIELVLLTLIAWVVWRQVIRDWNERRALRNAPPPDRQVPPTPPGQRAAAPGTSLTLVRCAACGVHFPSDRMLAGSQGRAFCSPACRAREGA